MIAYLQGTIHKKLGKSVIINTGKVGYLVHVPTPLFEKIKEKSEVEFFIHTKVREDDISLYGFETFTELDYFKTLLNVNGIGPKLALEILSLQPEKTKAAIITGDIAFLSKISGIGKKTAERIIVELKNKLTLDDITRLHGTLEHEMNDEVVEALQKLGYQKFEILKVLKTLPEKIIKTEEIVTYFLRNV